MESQTERLRELLGKREAEMVVAESAEVFQLRPVLDSPCRVACPAGVNVKAYVGLIAGGKFDRALEVVRATNPLPGICGRICTHPCESECRRGEVDEPVAIRPLKRFIADYARHAPSAKLPAQTPVRSQKVAVVGSGPAGLTAANDLVRLGYRVTILERENKPGGMLIWGIPPFRLPRDIIEQEIDSILGLGVEFIDKTEITDPARLLKEGFGAVFYAPGLQKGITLGFPQEDKLIGVMDSLVFLRRVYQGEISALKGRVLVIGGGDSAIDSARVALRLGADEVWVVYRRTREEMPAAEEEVAEAVTEGIRIELLTQPVDYVHKEGRLTGLRCVRTRPGPVDDSGRRRPVPIPGSEFVIPADWVITALGQRAEREIEKFPEGVFVGGDAAGGPATVIDAIASGHHGAKAIHQFLSGEQEGNRINFTGELEMGVSVLTAVPRFRVRPRSLPVHARRSFNEVEEPLSDEEAVAEAQRCLRCGPCGECVLCHNTCPKHQVALRLTGTGEEAPLLVRVHSLERIMPSGLKRITGRIRFSATGGEEMLQDVEVVLEPLVPVVKNELCRGCGICVANCPHQALNMKEWRMAVQVAVVEQQRCRGCGTCVVVCPTGALQWSVLSFKRTWTE